jgi:hypothetical protein
VRCLSPVFGPFSHPKYATHLFFTRCICVCVALHLLFFAFLRYRTVPYRTVIPNLHYPRTALLCDASAAGVCVRVLPVSSVCQGSGGERPLRGRRTAQEDQGGGGHDQGRVVRTVRWATYSLPPNPSSPFVAPSPHPTHLYTFFPFLYTHTHTLTNTHTTLSLHPQGAVRRRPEGVPDREARPRRRAGESHSAGASRLFAHHTTHPSPLLFARAVCPIISPL